MSGMHIALYCVVLSSLGFLLANAQQPTRWLRVDTKKGFRMCHKNHEAYSARVKRVDVFSKGCRRWPCIMKPGKSSGVFAITLEHNTDHPIQFMRSEVSADARLKFGGVKRVELDDKSSNAVCRFTRPGCPFYPGTESVIERQVKVPGQAKLVRSPLIVEFKITDERNEIVTCFMAPVIVL